VLLDTADAAGSGFASLSTSYGFTNVRRAVPALAHFVAAVSEWAGACRVPSDYSGSPEIVLSLVANNTLAAKAATLRVSTSVVVAGATEDAAYTNEAWVDVAVPVTANERFDVSFALSTAPIPGATLNVKVARDGAAAGDTLTLQNVLVWECLFQYQAG